MSLVLNEDQKMVQESASAFCQEQVPVSVMRRLRDDKDATGYDKDLWAKMVELGWTGMAIPEAYGGFGFGYGGLAVVLEETGKTLVNSPLISTVLLSATAVNEAGTETQKETLLPAIASGELVIAFAIDEKPVHAPALTALSAKASGDGFTLNGEKVMVLDGHVADKIIVVTRTTEGDNELGMFIVDANAPGVDIQRLHMVDNRNNAKVTFSNVSVTADQVLNGVDNTGEAIEKTLDIARLGIAAEMLGSMQQVFETTVQYLKDRTQFGVAIGSFQALQHRTSIMYSDIELCRSMVRRGFEALDENEPAEKIAQLASAAKAKVSDTMFLVSNEGVQMHGGIGMTDEFDIGFYLKRARVAQHFLGNASFHRDRYATLKGF
ncbi:acyl-CoA dehydrogenase family protein [Aurantivibrio plasticivorans]